MHAWIKEGTAPSLIQQPFSWTRICRETPGHGSLAGRPGHSARACSAGRRALFLAPFLWPVSGLFGLFGLGLWSLVSGLSGSGLGSLVSFAKVVAKGISPLRHHHWLVISPPPPSSHPSTRRAHRFSVKGDDCCSKEESSYGSRDVASTKSRGTQNVLQRAEQQNRHTSPAG